MSKYKYLSTFDLDNNDLAYHIFCEDCEIYLGTPKETSEVQSCPNCSKNIDVGKNSNFFISLSVESQLRKILKDQNVATSLLSYRINREKVNENAYEDLLDGEEYKKYCTDGGILSSPKNFSFSISSDGVPVGKSCGKTMWPIYLTINELPVKLRKKYVLLAGLYIGPKDPNHNTIMQPFVSEANKLSTEGFEWIYNGKVINSKVITICAIFDSVARWQVLNRQSFAAYYGCTFCYQKAERTQRGLRYTIPTKKIKLRTEQSTDNDLLKAFEKRENTNLKTTHHKGVKGPSALMRLKYFKTSVSVVVDYMHAILLGVIRLHTELILDSQQKGFWIGLSEDRLGMEHLKESIDTRLLQIKPPSSISRLPRSLNDMNIWKASEWRSWLLYYAIICLQGFLKRKHLIHLGLLSSATNILLQRSVTKEDIEKAHRYFLTYMFLFEKYFGKTYMVFNVHLLSHICRGVMNWGPLWTHNSFLYEGENRHLLQLKKSPLHTIKEISRKFVIFKNLPIYIHERAVSEETIDFCEIILDKKLRCFSRCETTLLGKGSTTGVFDLQEEICLSANGIFLDNCLSFKKMMCNGMRLASYQFGENKKNDDSYVLLSSGEVVLIRHILQNCNTNSIFLLVQIVNLKEQSILANNDITLEHINQVEGSGAFRCISPSEVSTQCIFMKVRGIGYVSKMAYGCYGD